MEFTKCLKKIVLSVFFVAAMVMGEAGTVLAAEQRQAEADTEAGPQYGDRQDETVTHDIALNTAVNTAVINTFEVDYIMRGDASLYSYLSIEVLGYGSKADIYINGKLFEQVTEGDASIDNPAPLLVDYTSFKDVLYGGTYKIDVIPYTYTESGHVAGPAVSKTVTIPDLNVAGMSYTQYGARTGNGYAKFDGVITLWFDCDAMLNDAKYEIQRKEGNGAWKTLDKIGKKYGYTDRTVSIGKKYQYRIRSAAGQNAYGKVAAGKWFYLKNVQTTAPPAYLTLSFPETGQGVGIDIKSTSVDGIMSGYELYRSTKEKKGYKKIARIAENSYVDRTAKKGTYYYKVRSYYYDTATGKIYYSTFSEPECIKLILDEITVSAKQTGNRQVTLEWNKIKGVSRYEVWYKSAIQGDAFRLYKSTKKTKLNVSGLLNNTNYTFVVRAKKNGSSYYSSNDCDCYVGFNEIYPYIAKNKVTSNKAKTEVTIKSTIKWNRIYGAKEIRIIGIYSSGDMTVLKTLKGTATSYTLTSKWTKGTKDARQYREIRISATNGKEHITKDISLYDAYRLDDTSRLTVKRAGSNACVISWKEVPGATNYRVYRQSPYGYKEELGWTSLCSYKDVSVVPGVKYTYSVSAENNGVQLYYYSYPSIVKTYIHKLGRPKIKSAKNTAKKTATITWSKVANADSYVVYRATAKKGKYKKLATISKGRTSYTDKKLKKGKTYYYKVKATVKNPAGLTFSSALSAYKAVRIKK
ncbi:MAG: hypothetical protein NC225_03110 [Clostridium sp.]|nr:hypothetical protein [Clostridium sp.]MCM1398454.1 hypothetical protein [Clostridium sp.]MCM1460176.1 hypothetical protein [Bacteroides sp.]